MFTKREQIRDWVKQYLQGKLTYDEFLDEFIKQTWYLYDSKYPEAREMANWVDNILLRYSEGFIDKSELREELGDIVFFNDPRMLELFSELSKGLDEIELDPEVEQALLDFYDRTEQ